LTVTVGDVCCCSVGKDWIVDLLSVHRSTVTEVLDQTALLQQIQDNFTAAGKLYAADIGGLFWVESLRMNVAFFLFSDATDKHLKARNRLPGGPQIHHCDADSISFTQTHFGRESSTTLEREREFWNLLSFLGTVCYRQLHVFPSEQLLCADNAASVCDRLRRQLLTSPTSTGNTAAASLVFIRRTNSSLVDHSQLLRRVLSYAQDDLLTARHSVYIVTDVGLGVRLPSLQGVLESSKYIHTAVYSGGKPMFSPISCVVIALHLSCS